MSAIEFDGAIPLPIGTQLRTPGRRVHSNPVLGLYAEEIDVRSSTESGWPTIVLGEQEDGRIGVAVDYPGDWHDGPIDEIDVVLTEDGGWSAVVAYRDRSTAVEDGNYESDGGEGYELHEWDPETHHDTIRDCADRDVTPIFYTPEAPDEYYAHAYRLADSFGALERTFGLSRYSRIEERQERLYELVVPREKRWEREDTGLRDLARDVLDP